VTDALPLPFGDYVLLERLGRGATGDVYLARPATEDQGVPTPVVIKRMRADIAREDGLTRRFEHEAAVAIRVSNSHVPRIWDAGHVEDVPYIVMGYVAGAPAGRVMNGLIANGQLPSVAVAATIVTQVLEGLTALHEAADGDTGADLRLIHRDIAPKNVIIGDNGDAVLIDLGLARSALQAWKTRTGAVMGTPGYMAPEQALGRQADQRTDLYAAGVLLWELLTLLQYVQPGSMVDVLRASAAPVFREPSAIRDDAPAALDRLCERALSVDPERRFQSARDMRTALAPFATASTREIAKLLTDALPGDRQEREAKLSRRLEDSWSGSAVAEQLGRTVVWARATGVRSPRASEVRRPPGASETQRIPIPLQAAAIVGLIGVMGGAFWIQTQVADPDERASTPAATQIAVPLPAAVQDGLRAVAAPARELPRATTVEAPPPREAPPRSAKPQRPVETRAKATRRRQRPTKAADDSRAPRREAPDVAIGGGDKATLAALMVEARALQQRVARDSPAHSRLMRLRSAIALDLQSDDAAKIARTVVRARAGLDDIEANLP